MKKKIVTVLMTAAIGTSMLAGQTVMAAETTTETAAETKTDEDKASDETEEKTIGKKPETDKDAEGVFSLKFKNLTGKVITGVTVKNEKDEKYPDNFLEKDDKFAADEERTLWFDPNAAKDEAANTDTAEDKGTEAAEEVQKYDMQITFEDETTATLHTLPFGDTEEAELHLEGDVAYIIFDSKDLKKSVNTKETEQALAPKPSYDYDEDYDYDYSYDEGDDGDYDDSGDSAAEGGDDGCLDNAILN